jgi:hypothetical protein
MRKFRHVATFLAVAGLMVLGPAGKAMAGGPPVQNFTKHFTNVQQSFPSTDPCTGAPIMLSITFDGVRHVTVFQDGTGHFTETDRGTFQLDYLDPNGNPDGDVDAQGTFVTWDGGNGLFDQNGNPIGKAEISFTLNGSGTNLDSGASFRFHNNGHVLTDPNGVVKLSFFKAQCA